MGDCSINIIISNDCFLAFVGVVLALVGVVTNKHGVFFGNSAACEGLRGLLVTTPTKAAINRLIKTRLCEC